MTIYEYLFKRNLIKNQGLIKIKNINAHSIGAVELEMVRLKYLTTIINFLIGSFAQYKTTPTC